MVLNQADETDPTGLMSTVGVSQKFRRIGLQAKITWLWAGVLVILALCALALLWFPVLRMGFLGSINYNEGWNAYRDRMAAQGRPLYGAPPGLWVTNYPFLSFHIIGLLSKLTGSVTVTGRAVALASLAAICVLLAGIVRRIAGSWRGGLYAGLCFFSWVATFTPERMAMNDPELLGAAIALFGVYAYVSASARLSWLIISALAFAAAIFTKHDIIALPLGIGLHLLATRNWRGLVVWVTAGAVAAGLLLFATVQQDGAYFFAHLLLPRAYAFRHILSASAHYLEHFSAPLVLCTVLLIWHRSIPWRGLLLLLLVITHAVSLFFVMGDGVANNIFYEPLIVTAAACAIAICSLERVLPLMSRSYSVFALALVLPALPGLIFTPIQLHADFEARQTLPAVTAAAQRTITLLRQLPGPAICEDILLCYRADKPLDYDPYFVKDQIMIGRLKETPILAMLKSHHYSAIEIGNIHHGPLIAPVESLRFTKVFMQTLLAEYRLVLIDRPYAVFVPRR